MVFNPVYMLVNMAWDFRVYAFTGNNCSAGVFGLLACFYLALFLMMSLFGFSGQ